MMKITILILTTAALVMNECAEQQVQGPPTSVTVPGLDINPYHTVTGRRVLAMQASAAEPAVVLPPTPTEIVLHFEFPCPLTNCYLQSSTNLTEPRDWENRYDFTVVTNDVDGTNQFGWSIRLNPERLWEFYRAGGETLP